MLAYIHELHYVGLTCVFLSTFKFPTYVIVIVHSRDLYVVLLKTLIDDATELRTIASVVFMVFRS